MSTTHKSLALAAFLIVSTLLTNTANAQVQYLPPSVRALKFGLNAGSTFVFGDVKNKPPRLTGIANLDYNITPYISAGVEGQYGQLAEGNTTVTKKSQGLFVESNYYAANANVKVKLGQFNKKAVGGVFNILNGAYLGAGFGFAKTSVNKMVEVFYYENGAPIPDITKEGMEYLVPINIGLDIDLPGVFNRANVVANVNFQYAQTFGETLDAYDFTNYLNKNSMPDAYAVLSVGLHINFGAIR